MWSWIKRTCRRITDPVLNPIRRKISRDWEKLTLSYFCNFIENVGVVCVLTFYATLIVGAIAGIMNWIFAPSILAVWMMYFVTGIGIPNFAILLTLVAVAKYIEKFQSRNGYEAVFWTARRAEKVGNALFRMMVFVLILYLLLVGLMALGWFAPSIFIGEYVIFFSALGSLIKAEIFSWFAWIMATVPWMNLFFQRFRQRLTEAENVALWNRRNREAESINRGCLEDWADEDDILDCRLERLGL